MGIGDAVKKDIQKLEPSYFALVMSTGIVSIASHLLHFDTISQLLFLLNVALFIILLLLLLTRLVMFLPDVLADLSSHKKGAGFLTIVAAAGILSLQFALLKQQFKPSIFLWFFSVIVWLIIMYSFFTKVITEKEKPSLEKGLNGSWLLVVVSTQSISILTSTIQSQLPFDANITAFFSLCTFLAGFMFYIIIITLIFYRLIFFKLTAEEFTPSYWIDMGACAITTLASITFITTNKGNILFNDLIPFLKTSAVLCWAIGTWWIPIIFILEFWRHVAQDFTIKYNPGYWSMVFPLGMYTVCTFKLADALNFNFLKSISGVFIYISWLMWLIVFVGMIVTLIKSTLLPKNNVADQ